MFVTCGARMHHASHGNTCTDATGTALAEVAVEGLSQAEPAHNESAFLALIQDLNVTVIDKHTGEILRELTIDTSH